MKPEPVRFFFEFASTYTYLAASRVDRAAAERVVPVAWRPFLLGPLFQRQGWIDSPFNLYPARGRYMWREIERFSARYGLPFRRPSAFPRNSVLAARVALAIEEEAWMPEFARAVFRANFEEDRDIADRAVIAGLLAGLGRDAGATIARALEPANKERLRARVEEAWEIGIFGAPSFVADGELYWGNDRLEEALDAWLRARSAEPGRPSAAGGRGAGQGEG